MAPVFQDDPALSDVYRCLCRKYRGRYESIQNHYLGKRVIKRTVIPDPPEKCESHETGEKANRNTVTRSANAFLIAYLMVFGLSVLIVSLDNYDFTTTFSAVAQPLTILVRGLASSVQ